MKLSEYKEALSKNNIPTFINTLKKMKTDNNNYAEIKRLNNFLKDYINNINDEEFIETDMYRIVPYKYSLTYMFSLYLQRAVDTAEYKVNHLKYIRSYSYFKKQRKSDDCILEDNFNKNIIDAMLFILSDYKGIDVDDTHGFKDTFEIKRTLDESNIDTALKNLGRLIDKENEFKDKNRRFYKESAIEDILEENAKGYNQAIYDEVNSRNMLNKISIIHIPLFNNAVPSMYIAEINTILVSQCFNNDTIERRLLSEFGMYTSFYMTKDITKSPDSFTYEHTDIKGMTLNNLYFDLFAYRMLKGTKLEHKDTFSNDIKSYPGALERMDNDAKYFDVLLES